MDLFGVEVEGDP